MPVLLVCWWFGLTVVRLSGFAVVVVGGDVAGRLGVRVGSYCCVPRSPCSTGKSSNHPTSSGCANAHPAQYLRSFGSSWCGAARHPQRSLRRSTDDAPTISTSAPCRPVASAGVLIVCHDCGQRCLSVSATALCSAVSHHADHSPVYPYCRTTGIPVIRVGPFPFGP